MRYLMDDTANHPQKIVHETVEQKQSKLRKTLERVRMEVLSRYIPFELQEEIRKVLDGN
jgi:hypothetical protein